MRDVGAVLLVDGGVEPMKLLAVRLARINVRGIRAKTPEEAFDLLRLGRIVPDALVIPPDLPVADLKSALRDYRACLRGPTAIVAAGPDPGPRARRRLCDAGVDLAVFEPIDAHSLRFQVNRAFSWYRPARRERAALRAPATWPVTYRLRGRLREARLYSISARGAFLATPTPALRNADFGLVLPIGRRHLRVKARVAMTNVPGNLMRPALPAGMGVTFEGIDDDTSATLEWYARRRLAHLAL